MQTKTQHTHGKWRIGSPIRSTDTIGICRDWTDGGETGEETIAEVLPGCSREQMESEAALIAAAPELLEACNDLAGAAEYINNGFRAGVEITAEDWSVLHDRTQRAKVIIAKAQGKP